MSNYFYVKNCLNSLAPRQPVAECLEVSFFQVEPDDGLSIAEQAQGDRLESSRKVLVVVPLRQRSSVVRRLDSLRMIEQGVEVSVEGSLGDGNDLVEVVHVGGCDNFLPGGDTAVAVGVTDSAGMSLSKLLVLAPGDFIFLLLKLASEVTMLSDRPALIVVVDDMELSGLEDLKVVLAEEVDDVAAERHHLVVELVEAREVAIVLVEVSS